MGFQDSFYVKLGVILAALVWDIVWKNRQTNRGENPTLTTAVGVGKYHFTCNFSWIFKYKQWQDTFKTQNVSAKHWDTPRESAVNPLFTCCSRSCSLTVPNGSFIAPALSMAVRRFSAASLAVMYSMTVEQTISSLLRLASTAGGKAAMIARSSPTGWRSSGE